MQRRGAYESAWRYGVVGGLSTFFQYTVLIFLVEVIAVNPNYAAMAGFILGCLLHYLLLYYWTFQATGGHCEVVLRYVIVTFMVFWLNLAVFSFLFDICHVQYLIAQSSATLAVAVINYWVNRSYTFS